MRIDISNRIGTTSNFGGFRGLLDKFSGAAAGYSLRKLSKSATNAVRVRRSSDNTEQDIGFVGTELDTTTLLNFVNARDVAPADYGAGAAAAYSLRYVSDSYTGDVVRVRRDSDNAEADFNPTEITDGTLLAWVGNTASDNGYVTTWYDQSGNSNDATQGTAASQPKIVDAGVLVEENGKPAVDFDGTDDYLSASSWGISGTQDRSFFITAKADANTINETYLGIGDLNVSILYSKWDITTETAVRINGGNEIYGPPSTNQSILSHIFSGTNVTDNTAYINGVEPSAISANVNTINTDDTYNFIGLSALGLSGNNREYDGLMQEIIIYSSDQSSNRGNIEANVNDYYSIYTSTNDGFVTTWYDQAGSNDATQATAAAQPQIVDGGSLITENGKVAVSFDGSDDALNTSHVLSSAFSFFLTAKYDATTNTLIGNNLLTALPPNKYVIFISDTGTNVTGFRSDGTLTTGYTSTLSQHLGTFIGNGSGSVSAYFNSSLSDTDSGHETSFSGSSVIGGITNVSPPRMFNGKAQEIIIYNSDQSGNRTAIESAINGHYNIYP